MKTTATCKNWNESNGLNGVVMFCSAGAYGKKLTAIEAKECGCTVSKREACLKMMIDNIGYGLVPEVNAEVPVSEVYGREAVLGLV